MPDDELLDAGRARPPEGPGGARAADAADAGRSPFRMRSSTTSSGSGCSFAESRGRRRIRISSRSSTKTCARRSSGSRPLPREPGARGPPADRAAQRRLHVPERAARPALRDSRMFTGSRFRRVTLDRPAARRAARHGQRAGRHLVRQPDVAGPARQVDARESSRHAAAAAAGRRAAVPSRGRRERRDSLGARAAGVASQEPGLRQLPRARWIRSGSLWRISTRSASGGRSTPTRRSMRRACWSTGPSSRARRAAPDAGLASGPDRPDHLREDADLRARPGARINGCARGSPDRARAPKPRAAAGRP